MNRCPYCKKIAWPWQRRFFILHRICLEIYCQGYASGVKVACEQAAKIMTEIQPKSAPPEKPMTMQ